MLERGLLQSRKLDNMKTNNMKLGDVAPRKVRPGDRVRHIGEGTGTGTSMGWTGTVIGYKEGSEDKIYVQPDAGVHYSGTWWNFAISWSSTNWELISSTTSDSYRVRYWIDA